MTLARAPQPFLSVYFFICRTSKEAKKSFSDSFKTTSHTKQAKLKSNEQPEKRKSKPQQTCGYMKAVQNREKERTLGEKKSENGGVEEQKFWRL
ncbi:hypothetical protein MA16_Dca007289 [Dendrobium catenatum]|uniref:Uncharacterized protein n=1 Tax=Dendrobium catenatum TaxID=906689 RepID=A0A2I0W6L1_9ASPA|nr:hypothetical protein MA16_Dca007289 [Dendrobium catenatum]